jgi:hypothetical protein
VQAFDLAVIATIKSLHTRICFNTERIMRWHLVLKEFGPADIQYIKDERNVVADALSPIDR